MQREIIEKIKKIEKEQMRRYQNDTLLRYNAGKKKHKKQIKFHKLLVTHQALILATQPQGFLEHIAEKSAIFQPSQ